MWRALLDQDYQVVALAPADGQEESLKRVGIDFVALPELRRFANSPWLDYRLLRALVNAYRRIAPDVIFHFTVKPNIYGSLAAHKVGCPSIATITGLGTTWLNGALLRWATTKLYRYSLPKAEAVIGQNAHDLEELQRIGVVAKRWQLIPGSGVDLQHFTPQEMPEYADGERHFLFLGRMLIDKGVLELFNAWRQIHHLLPDGHLHLVGEFNTSHPRTIPVKEWEVGLKLPRVTFHGYQEEVRNHLQSSHVVILPSYREGMPRSLLEAMAMGKPIIATDVPGCRELTIPRRNGWRIPARSSAALAEAILQADRSSNVLLADLGRQGRQLVEGGYSETIVAQQYLELIEEILNLPCSERTLLEVP